MRGLGGHGEIQDVRAWIYGLARENLASLKAIKPTIELQLITAQNALDVILGRRPASSEKLPETLEELPQMEILVLTRFLSKNRKYKTILV